MQIEEREQIREKRSSAFTGRKKDRRISSKGVLIGAAILAILLLAYMVPYFWNVAKDNTTLPPAPVTIPEKTPGKIISSPSFTPSPTSPVKTIDNTSTPPVDLVIGRIGFPLEKNGFEITVKSISITNIQTSVWLIAKNTGKTEKSFKLNPKPIIIDNQTNQYENLMVARAGIVQSDLYPGAKREGPIFFDRFKDGTKAQKLIFYVNGDRFEFKLDDEKNP